MQLGLGLSVTRLALSEVQQDVLRLSLTLKEVSSLLRFMQPDPRFISCLRYVALRMLSETEGRPARITVDLAQLIAEAERVYMHGP